jgi:small subunit ribosomal protein S4
MGDPKFARKHYTTPSHPWDGTRISEENQIIHKYGLKNKRELWKIQTLLRNLRRQARELQARLRTNDPQAIVERDALLARLSRQGLLGGEAELNDVLSLEVEALLARRLQTQIYLKGLARSVKQARQLIVHGHIAIDGRNVTVPSYIVPDAESALIDYYFSSPMVSDLHPERPAADFKPDMTTVKEERRLSDERERDMRRQRELDRIAAMKQAIAAHQAGEAEAIAETEDEQADILEADKEEGEPEDADAEGEAPKEEAPKGEKAPKKEEPPKEKPTKGGDS